MDASVTNARTFLFVPGNRSERFDKAVRSGADAVIVDLEDSVAPGEKTAARRALLATWPQTLASGTPLLVRINACGTPEHPHDIEALRSLHGVAGVMVPKAESAADLASLRACLQLPIVPLIESVAGLGAVQAIAAVPGVTRLAIGHIDFMADAGLECDAQESELIPLRFGVAMATRAAGIAAAIDGVTVQIDDEASLQADTLRACRFGFGGKLCIHPRQIAIVHQALAPTEQELAWARRVLAADAAAAGAAVQLDGRMVDAPVVLRARRTAARGALPGTSV